MYYATQDRMIWSPAASIVFKDILSKAMTTIPAQAVNVSLMVENAVHPDLLTVSGSIPDGATEISGTGIADGTTFTSAASGDNFVLTLSNNLTAAVAAGEELTVSTTGTTPTTATLTVVTANDPTTLTLSGWPADTTYTSYVSGLPAAPTSVTVTGTTVSIKLSTIDYIAEETMVSLNGELAEVTPALSGIDVIQNGITAFMTDTVYVTYCFLTPSGNKAVITKAGLNGFMSDLTTAADGKYSFSIERFGANFATLIGKALTTDAEFDNLSAF